MAFIRNFYSASRIQNENTLNAIKCLNSVKYFELKEKVLWVQLRLNFYFHIDQIMIFI